MEKNLDKNYTRSFKDVLTDEKSRIGIENENEKLYGLAISGGGIRSSSFGLGVLQALVLKDVDLLKKIHYLSTVSGGGYIGSSLTWFLNQGLPDGDTAGTSTENFPFGAKGFGAKNMPNEDIEEEEKEVIPIAEEKENKNAILDFIRQHGNYLTPGKGIDFISLIGVVIRSTFVSLLVYFSLLSLLMTLLKLSGAFTLKLQILLSEFINLKFPFPFDENILLNTSFALLLLIVLMGIIYSFSTIFKVRYKYLINSQKWVGYLWTTILVLIVLGILPLITNWAESAISASASGIGGILLGLYEQFKSRKPDNKKSVLSTFRILLGAAALIYGLLVLSYLTVIYASKNYENWWILIPLTIVVILGIGVNLNKFGLHRMYRDRLMETFMANKKNIVNNTWGPATEADSCLIETMCDKNINPKPYHIINTNIITADSPRPKFNGRGGDNFILSPEYCGSDATGWRKTNDYRKYRFGNNGITLATAMATSGAAINPSAGPNGQGLTKNKLISVLLGLLNIQLGFWSDNPDPNKKVLFRLPSNFLFPGLFGNVLGRKLNENQPSVLLTDGGHFENLGLYELIRRRLDVIIVSDAGADEDFKFDDMTNLIEKIRVDFGTKIKFGEVIDCGDKSRPCDKFPLKDMIPDQKDGPLGEKLLLANKGFAIANIYYSEQENQNNKGILIYIKTTLTKDLPADLYGYKMSNPTYPDETTADQFFSEIQFETYRELGFQLAKSVDWDLVKRFT